jgi:hypothetical protein
MVSMQAHDGRTLCDRLASTCDIFEFGVFRRFNTFSREFKYSGMPKVMVSHPNGPLWDGEAGALSNALSRADGSATRFPLWDVSAVLHHDATVHRA